MDKQTDTIIDALVSKIDNLNTQLWIKDYEIEKLKKEKAQLEEFLNPTKKVGEKDE